MSSEPRDEQAPKEEQGFIYQFAKRQYPSWIYFVVVLAYTGLLYLIISWLYFSRL